MLHHVSAFVFFACECLFASPGGSNYAKLKKSQYDRHGSGSSSGSSAITIKIGTNDFYASTLFFIFSSLHRSKRGPRHRFGPSVHIGLTTSWGSAKCRPSPCLVSNRRVPMAHAMSSFSPVCKPPIVADVVGVHYLSGVVCETLVSQVAAPTQQTPHRYAIVQLRYQKHVAATAD